MGDAGSSQFSSEMFGSSTQVSFVAMKTDAKSMGNVEGSDTIKTETALEFSK